VGRYGIGETLLQLFDGRDAIQTHCEHVCRSATQMHVRVVETGHHEMAAELDCFDAFAPTAAIEHDLFETADADDLAVADGHGGGPGMLRIVCVDAAVEIVDGGWRRRNRLGVGERGCEEHETGKREKQKQKMTA
jgi:hypothetical protein